MLFFGLTIHVPKKLADYAEALFFFDDFGAGCDGAEFGVDDDLFDERGLWNVFFVTDRASAVAAAAVVTAVSGRAGGLGGAGEVGAGDLKTVEEKAGTFGGG